MLVKYEGGAGDNHTKSEVLCLLTSLHSTWKQYAITRVLIIAYWICLRKGDASGPRNTYKYNIILWINYQLVLKIIKYIANI